MPEKDASARNELYDKIKSQLGSEVGIGGAVFSSLKITELTDNYAKLESRKYPDDPSGLEMIIRFDPKDEDDIMFRENLKRVYDWHMKYCKNCKSGKEKPSISYELRFNALLAELVGLPLPEEPKPTKEVDYNLEKVAPEFFDTNLLE